MSRRGVWLVGALSVVAATACGRIALDDDSLPEGEGGVVPSSDAGSRAMDTSAGPDADRPVATDAALDDGAPNAADVLDASGVDTGPPITLTVSLLGGGQVEVTLPGGVQTIIATTTSFQTVAGQVRVRALDSAGAYFSSWDVPTCKSADCSFLLDDARTVMATFVDSFVNVEKQDGAGNPTTGGRLFTANAALDCGTACGRGVASGTSLTVYAAPANGYAFVSWMSGPCAGSTNPECWFTVGPLTTTIIARVQPANLMFLTPGDMTPSELVTKGTPLVSSTTGTDAERMVAGADAHCAELGAATSRSGTKWRSWLSRVGENAIDRFPGARGWLRVDGAPVLDELDASAMRVMYPPWLTQLGQKKETLVLTGTDFSGRFMQLGGNCYERAASQYPYQGAFGNSPGGSSSWTFYAYVDSCAAAVPYYCMGTDFATPIRLPRLPGRRMFVSRGVSPSGGLAGFDAACAADANDSALAGHYKALVATPTSSAASRFALWHQRVIRTDNVVIAESDDELFAWHLLAAPERAANGLPGPPAWTGAPDTQSVGTSTCNGWTSTNAKGLHGDSRNADAHAFAWTEESCLSQFGVYCLEE